VERAIAMARDAGDEALEALAHAQRATILAAGLGHTDDAMPDVEDALRLYPAIKSGRQRAQVLWTSAAPLEWHGDFDRAQPLALEAVKHAEQEHAGPPLGAACFLLGHIHLARGGYEEARRWYLRLQDYAVTAGERFWMVRAPNSLGGVHLDLYDFDEALRL